MRKKHHLAFNSETKIAVFAAVIISFQCAIALSPDGLSLLAFKAAVSDDPSSSLTDWNEDDDDPCRWPGITCSNITNSSYPRVVGISVSGKNLSGYIPSELGTLLFLRRLNLHGNRLTGEIPAQLFNASSLHSLFLYDNLLSGNFPSSACNLPRLQNLDLSKNSLSGPLPPELRACRQLQRLILSGNHFSGKIPPGIFAEMVHLVSLDISSNNFSGAIPPDLGALDSLAGVLNLSHNKFSGQIPTSLGSLPSTVSLDLRFNNLSGMIPATGSLANQGPIAFLNNPGLCGFPLEIACEDIASPATSSPSPPIPTRREETGEPMQKRRRLRASLIVLISLVDVVGVAIVGLILVYTYWKFKNSENSSAKLREEDGDNEKSKRGYCRCCFSALNSSRDGESSEDGEERGREKEGELVAMEKGFKVELEELLRASAYVLGKGGNGIVYKVVVGDGIAVAVRRLGDGGGGGGGGGKYEEFVEEVREVGKVKHRNVVRLRAYYWAQDEKLLVSDFISNGNLAALMRGRSGQPSLSWSIRLRIAKGTARGLAHIHDSSPRKFIHGSIKPSNILLDVDFNPYISDFGLHRLLTLATTDTSATTTTSSSSKLFDRPNPYRAPEARAPIKQQSQKSDVYSFGLILLELLTGRPLEGAAALGAASTSREQVVDLVRWVRRGFEEVRPVVEMVEEVVGREVMQSHKAKKEVVSVFHLALACTEAEPEVRPRMRTVMESLDRIGS